MNFNRSTDLGLLLLRFALGFFMIYGHGWGKLMRLFGGEEIKFADPFGLGPVPSLILVILAEVLCAILIMLGLFTRQAVIPLIIAMAVAFFMVHFNDPFGRQEKALLYLFGYLTLFFTGGGWYSLDRILFKKS